LHFATLLFALDAIALQHFERFEIAAYENIPFNKTSFHDLIVREVEIEKAGRRFTVDIGFRRSESTAGAASISDLGDLSIFHGYNEVPPQGLRLVPGKVYPPILPDVAALKTLDLLSLLKQGYTELQLSKLPSSIPAGDFPFRFVAPGKGGTYGIKIGRNPSFLLMKEGKTRWAIVNGYAFDLERDAERIRKAGKVSVRNCSAGFFKCSTTYLTITLVTFPARSR